MWQYIKMCTNFNGFVWMSLFICRIATLLLRNIMFNGNLFTEVTAN